MSLLLQIFGFLLAFICISLAVAFIIVFFIVIPIKIIRSAYPKFDKLFKRKKEFD